MRVTREAVRAARIAAQHLAARLPSGAEATAAAPGLRDTPAGAFRDALAARIDGGREEDDCGVNTGCIDKGSGGSGRRETVLQPHSC